MIHLNEGIGEINSLLAKIVPQIYCATTLHDFAKNKKEILPTKTLFPLFITFYGLAWVSIESSLTYRGPKIKGQGLCDKEHLSLYFGIPRTFKWAEKSNYPAKLSDLTTTMDISIHPNGLLHNKSIEDGDRLDGAFLLYKPSDSLTLLVDSGNEPNVPEREGLSDLVRKLAKSHA